MRSTALTLLTSAVLAAVGSAQEAPVSTDPLGGSLHPELQAPAPILAPGHDVPPACEMNVSYERGYLRISAKGCRLLDVLRQVEKRIGAVVDVAPGLGEDAVFADLGPGPASEVLASLLYGSSFNYIILGSRSNSRQITRVILTASQVPSHGGDSSSLSAAPMQAAAEEASAYGLGFTVDPDHGSNERETASSPRSRAEALAAQQSPDGNKTPGQILDELQKQQLKKLDEEAAQPKQ